MNWMRRALSLLLALCLLLGDTVLPVLAQEITEGMETVQEAAGGQVPEDGEEPGSGESTPAPSTEAKDDPVTLELTPASFTPSAADASVLEYVLEEGEAEISLSGAVGMLLAVGEGESAAVAEDPYVFAVTGPCVLSLSWPVGSEHNPIALKDWTWDEAEKQFQATITAAVGTTWYQVEGIDNARDMTLSAGTWAENTQAAVFCLKNEGEEAQEIMLTLSWPAGSERNPIILKDWTWDEAEKQFQATITAAVGTTWYQVEGIDNARDMTLSAGTWAEDTQAAVFCLKNEGEEAQEIMLTLSWPAGSENNPIVLKDWTWNEEEKQFQATITATVGTTWYQVEGIDNARDMTLSAGTWAENTQAAVFCLKNEGEEAQEIILALYWPVGSQQRPIVLTKGDFKQIQENPPVYMYEVPNGAAAWFTLQGAEGMLVTADGEAVEDCSLFRAAEVIELYWPVGSVHNPDQLIVEEENSITVPENGYWFVWVGDKAGTLVFDGVDGLEIWSGETCYSRGEEIPVEEGETLLKIAKPVGSDVRFTAIFLEEPMPVELAKGKSLLMTGPNGEALKVADYKWETGDGSVAIVSAGKVTAKGAVGESTLITATHKENGTLLRYRVRITVPATRIAMIDERYSTPEKDFEINGRSGWIEVTMQEDGEAYAVWKLTAKVYPNDACRKVIWTSSDPTAAVVEDGVVRLLDAGVGKTVTITAMTADGTAKKATFKIRIMRTVDSLIFVEGAPGEVAAGKSLKLAPALQVAPANASNQKVTWKLVDPATGEPTAKILGIASISTSGVLTADKKAPAGSEVTVRATAADSSGRTAEHKVIIRAATTAVQLFLEGYDGDAAGKTVDVYLTGGQDKPLVLTANNMPEGAGQGWTWTCSDKTIPVTEGRLTVPGSMAGKTITVTATATDGTGKKAIVKLRIIQPVEQLQLPESEEVAGGKSLKLASDLQILPANATNKKVKWYLVDDATGQLVAKLPGLASISTSGAFTADKKAANETTVTVKCIPADGFVDAEGKAVEAVCRVTIKPITTGVTVTWENRTDDSDVFLMGKGGPGHMVLKAANAPADAKQDWDWKASNTDVQFEKTVDGVKVTFGPKCAGKSITITATANDGSGKKATLKVKAVQPVESLSWTGTGAPAAVAVGQGKSQKLAALVRVDTAGATNKKLNWVLYKKDGAEIPATVATVKDGTLKAVKVTEITEAYVQVSPADGYSSASGEPLCSPLVIGVTLYPRAVTRVAMIDERYSTPEKDFEINGRSGWIEVTSQPDGMGSAVWELRGKVYPYGDASESGACQTILWTSSNEAWAQVDETGKVTLLEAGIGKTVTITASAVDGSGKKATFKIRIIAG